MLASLALVLKMPKQGSKGPTCIGVIRTRAKCTLSRANPGEAICIKGPCNRCNEWRCRSRCRCGRTGTASGRHRARPHKNVRRAVEPRAPQPALPVRAAARPALRAAQPHTEYLAESQWMSRALSQWMSRALSGCLNGGASLLSELIRGHPSEKLRFLWVCSRLGLPWGVPGSKHKRYHAA